MRCKKHFTDCSSAAGVCASCLRERLLTIIETQSKYEAQVVLVKPQLEDEHRKSDVIHQHNITFPKSVSPYISRRKSDLTAVWPHLPHSLSEQQFYTTPQIGPNGIIMTSKSSLRDSRAEKKFTFTSFSNLFRSKISNSDSIFDAKHKKSNSMREAQLTKPLSWWFTNLFTSKKNKNLNIVAMSFPDEYESSSGTSLKNTPMRATPQRRKQNQSHARGLSFCLSPLVRQSPNRSWNLQKGVLPEMVTHSGEMKVSPGRPSLGAAASFRANRSRKLANFGRFHPNY